MENRNYTNPFVTILHPFDASYDIRFKNRGSVGISCVILVLLFFASVFSRQNTKSSGNEQRILTSVKHTGEIIHSCIRI